ncbi:MAG: hypothetical protein C5B51_16625 [Terriglobia bacterium]|nr:MAG: hypothetical protein C5B51_16625 [Terriglobia bacterium]
MLGATYKAIVPSGLRQILRRRFDAAFCKDYRDKETLGSRCPWTILTGHLGPSSVVYSGGVGEDISFEMELIERFGVTVHLFDPSPMALDTIAGASRYRDKLHFKALGLAGASSAMAFAPVDDGRHGLSHWRKAPDSSEVETVPCTTLLEEMKLNNHTRIDLLKIDIEGFEYEVLESCLANDIFPTQICVEFHHFLGGGASRATTASLLLRLGRSGYHLIHKSQYDYTLYRREHTS